LHITFLLYSCIFNSNKKPYITIFKYNISSQTITYIYKSPKHQKLVKVRNSFNLVKSLKDVEGNLVEDMSRIKEIVIEFYQKFTTKNKGIRDMATVTGSVPCPWITTCSLRPRPEKSSQCGLCSTSAFPEVVKSTHHHTVTCLSSTSLYGNVLHSPRHYMYNYFLKKKTEM
jgi:hypothetical protein